MESFRTELVNAIQEVISLLSDAPSRDSRELCAMRLEILAENSLVHQDIPLEAVDMLNKAIHTLKETFERLHEPYQATLDQNTRRSIGRPKYYISEEQLTFFRGKIERGIFQYHSIH